MKCLAVIGVILVLFALAMMVVWRLGVSWTVRQLREGRKRPPTGTDTESGQ